MFEENVQEGFRNLKYCSWLFYLFLFLQGSWCLLVLFSSREAIHGNPSIESVVFGNAMAEIVGRILIPLCEWLFIPWLAEQPVPRPI